VKIVAIKVAFYNGRRVRVGDQLEIPTGTMGSWFAPVASPEAKAAKAEPVKQAPQALSKLGGEKAKSFTEVLA
jgi:hypothetical protein